MPELLESRADWVLEQLQALGTERTKKAYLRHGAREPLFGVATGAMKPIAKQTGLDHDLAMRLYATGNYDAMYFAGMITDPALMTETDFERWIEGAYCCGISDFIVAVSLAETSFAQTVADRWIQSDVDLYASAGWSCYTWLLGVRPDNCFDKSKLLAMLGLAVQKMPHSPGRVRNAMNGFIAAVGISYLPLHEQALQAARQTGTIDVEIEEAGCKTPAALETIQKAAAAGRIGFKRRKVRC